MKYKPYENEFWNEKEAKNLFQTLPFYNVLIKNLRLNIELLHELPFYDEFNITEVSKAFKRYARSYKVEILDHKYPLIQLEASKSSIKDLFKGLLNEMKGFKYQITVAVLLSKEKGNGDIGFSSVYFTSLTKEKIKRRSREDYSKIEKQSNICINMFCYENRTIYTLYISGERFSDCMDLLLIFDENKSHYVYIKDFNRLMFNKTKNKNKKCFCRCYLQCFSSKNVLTEHKENCLVTNGKQNVKLRKGSISFKNYSKQLQAPFKIYVDFECILRPTSSKKLVIKMAHTQKNIKIKFLSVLLTKLFVLIINLVKMLLCTEGKILFTNLLKQLLGSIIIVRR